MLKGTCAVCGKTKTQFVKSGSRLFNKAVSNLPFELHLPYSLMQNNVQISGKWSKSKPKVDFQYGGRLFFKNGSSYISAIN